MLDHQLFRPSSTERRRAKKREAQRKYRNGIRQRPEGLTETKTPTSGPQNDEGRTTRNGVNQQRNQITHDENDWDSMMHMQMSQPPIGQSQHQQVQQHQQQRSQQIQGNDKGKAFCDGPPYPSFSSSHMHSCQQKLPFPDRFEDMLAGDVFPHGNSTTIQVQDSQTYSDSSQCTIPVDASGSCQCCTTIHRGMNDALSPLSQTAEWKHHPDARWTPARPIRIPASTHHHGLQPSPASNVQRKFPVPISVPQVFTQGLPATQDNVPPAKPNETSPSGNQVGMERWDKSTAIPSLASIEAMPMSPIARGSATGLQGCTPLFQAVFLGNLKIVAMLMDRSSNPNASNEAGQTCLHVAVREGHAHIVDYLIRCGSDLNQRDDTGNTPLHLAVVNGHEKVVELLVDAGANVEITND